MNKIDKLNANLDAIKRLLSETQSQYDKLRHEVEKDGTEEVQPYAFVQHSSGLVFHAKHPNAIGDELFLRTGTKITNPKEAAEILLSLHPELLQAERKKVVEEIRKIINDDGVYLEGHGDSEYIRSDKLSRLLSRIEGGD